jgi:hypothetical protein
MIKLLITDLWEKFRRKHLRTNLEKWFDAKEELNEAREWVAFGQAHRDSDSVMTNLAQRGLLLYAVNGNTFRISAVSYERKLAEIASSLTDNEAASAVIYTLSKE